jgi:hypothetical protein
MKHIVWAGSSDARHLGPKDLAKAGVEVTDDLIFPRLTPVKVNNEIAKALTENQALFGKFAEVADDDAENQLDLAGLETKAPEATEKSARNAKANQ